MKREFDKTKHALKDITNPKNTIELQCDHHQKQNKTELSNTLAYLDRELSILTNDAAWTVDAATFFSKQSVERL